MLCLTAPEGRAAPRVARAANTALAAAPSYARHVPERTLLYALVEAHYPDFIASLEAQDRSLPEYVREEFETYLRCGVLEHGFLRVVCEQCRAERLVAFSCKKRGFCPSCGARRMAESARHLVEEVFGPRPVRQWVLSFPYPLRFLFASKPEAIGPVLVIVQRVIAGWLADQVGVDHASAQCGAVTLIQRFGSALNLNVHFHMLWLDGVYDANVEPPRRKPRLRRARAPTSAQLTQLANTIAHRVCRHLSRRGWLEGEDESVFLSDSAGIRADGRPEAVRPAPAHALSEQERAAILEVANAPQYAALPPAQIVPRLADEGRYLASESSFHRVLHQAGQASHRGRAKTPQARRKPTTHVARAPNQVWCWDVTWLPSQVTGRWFYLYLILDLYSRKIVGHEVHEVESDEHAAHLLKRTALAEGIHAATNKPVLHGDNGAALKATTVLAMLQWLGVAPSYSRPRVSDDNAFVESLFRTAKYRPGFPIRGFADLQDARTWAAQFVHWYNHEHLHSGLRFVAPAVRHAGQDAAQLQVRTQVYELARQRHPQRWTGTIRDWSRVGAVTLNPDRDTVVPAQSKQNESKRLAA